MTVWNLEQHLVSLLSVTTYFSLCLPVWPFGTGWNTFDFQRGHRYNIPRPLGCVQTDICCFHFNKAAALTQQEFWHKGLNSKTQVYLSKNSNIDQLLPSSGKASQFASQICASAWILFHHLSDSWNSTAPCVSDESQLAKPPLSDHLHYVLIQLSSGIICSYLIRQLNEHKIMTR